MDKKKSNKTNSTDDLSGFTEFIEGQSEDSNFLPRPQGSKKEISFEHFTFLQNDSERLIKIKNLLTNKIPFIESHKQGAHLLTEQKGEIDILKNRLFEIYEKKDSPYKKSLKEIFDSFSWATQTLMTSVIK